MLSIFPELFTYSLIAPFILRIALGGYFILQGAHRRKAGDDPAWDALWNNAKIGSLPTAPVLAKIQIIIGVLLFVGLYTQVAAILAIIFVGIEWRKQSQTAPLPFQELRVTVLAGAIGVSLLFLGAGFLAFDLPL